MQTKRKVSVTVPEDLLEEVDRLAGDLSRSAVFEQALVSWLRQHRQADLDQAIKRYYRSLSQEERAEDGHGPLSVTRSFATVGGNRVQTRYVFRAPDTEKRKEANGADRR